MKSVLVGISAETVRPTGRIVLTGARIVTMKGDEVIENGTVLVNGEVAYLGGAYTEARSGVVCV